MRLVCLVKVLKCCAPAIHDHECYKALRKILSKYTRSYVTVNAMTVSASF